MTKKVVVSKYYPHSKQKEFHNGRYRQTFRACICGTGSGKTIAGAFESLSWLMDNPKSVGYAFEPTFPMVKRILLPTLESDLLLGFPLDKNPLVERFNKSDFCIILKNGSRLWLGSLDDPERAEGPNIDFIWVDEARLIRHFDLAWQVIQRRLRGSGVGSHIGAWVTTTPPSPGPLDNPTPIYKFFEHPKFSDPDSKVYRWSIFDNPYLPKRYLAEMRRTHKGKLGDRFLYGRFVDIGAGSFAFDSTIHVTDEMPLEFRNIIGGCDFGWTNPSCLLVIGLDGDGRAYVIDEFYSSRIRVEKLIEEAKEFRDNYDVNVFICDRSEPRTIAEFKRAQLNAKPDKSKRDAGIRALGGRFEVEDDGRPRIYIHPRCVNLISELQIYDEKKKEHDHAVDALRYALASLISEPEGGIEISFKSRPR